MKYFFLLALCLSLFGRVYGQTPVPSDTVGCYLLTVTFEDTVGDMKYWNFGDGAKISDTESPSHVFTNETTELIEFVVEYAETESDPTVGTFTIAVYPTPDLLIVTADTNTCTEVPVTFCDNTDTTAFPPNLIINEWSWTYGDGSGSVSAFPCSAPKIFSSSGQFDMSLAISTNMPTCDVTKIFSNFSSFSDRPDVKLSASETVSCEIPFDVSFTTTPADSSLVYEWEFGDGDVSTENSPIHTYDEIGAFTVTLNVSDVNGCAAFTQFENITVGTPTAMFE